MQYFKQLVKYFLICLLPALFLQSCKQEESDLGKDFIETHSKMSIIDTLDVKVSTVMYDSLITSGLSTILCGTIKSDAGEIGYGPSGTITSQSYIELMIPTFESFYTESSETRITDLRFDSITFNLSMNAYVYGDSTRQFEISIHQLSDTIQLINDSYLLNRSSANYNETPLCTRIFTPRPKLNPTLQLLISSDSLNINSTWGQEIFNFLVNNYTIESDDVLLSSIKLSFLNFFKGLTIVSGKNNQCILGFSCSGTSGYMRLYYHINGKTNTTQYVDFRINKYNKQFNRIQPTYTSYPFSLRTTITSDTTISSELTDHCAYMQNGTGMAPRISFPTIKNVLLQNKYFKILRADLIIKPVIRTYSDIFPLPSKLYLCQTNETNNIYQSIPLEDNSGQKQTGNLKFDQFNPLNTYYSYDVTGYITSLLNYNIIDKQGLLLINSDFSVSFDHLVIGDRFHSNNKIMLKVYYLTYEK